MGNSRGLSGCSSDPSVGVIVVNWNGELLLKSCLGSLLGGIYPRCKITFVDNASTDGSVEVVRNSFPEVRIIQLPENQGFTGGNAAGFKVSDDHFVALVNNDTRIDKRWLNNLIQPMKDDPTIGICASKLLFDEKLNVNSAGDGLTTGGVGFNLGLGKLGGHFDEPGFVFGACGAAVLYRRRMLDDIGFLDDDFFLYDEDTDLNFRAQLAGWKCLYVPDAVVYHKGNATAGRLSDTHVYYHTRNLEFVWIKNMPLGLMFRFAHHKLFQEIGSF